MLRKKEKAQGLVEFALILPVLLLLLLGIIEAARVIWVYITVQTAVREAARYAISGKPYSLDAYSTACLNPSGDPAAQSPWVCDPVSRTEAIEAVAMNRVTTTLNYSNLCNSYTYVQCQSVANAFGVQVIGQYVDPLTPTEVLTKVRHSGTQGLNVKVSAFYNVQMFDPIFDRIMGGGFIPVRAELSMQNEGIDKALGGVPPPAINNTVGITGTGGEGDGPNGQRIRAQNYRVPQLGILPVRLENHFNSTTYDIYLSQGTPETTFKICSGVQTDSLGNGDYSCFISGVIPSGFYTLYSTLVGDLNPLATDTTQQVEIYISEIAKIQVDNGAGSNTLVANSVATITLVAHQVTNQPYTVTVVYGAGPTEQVLFTGVTVVSATNTFISWTVPPSLLSPSNPCPTGGGTPCLIRSRDKINQIYASGEFYLNQPEIVIAGGLRTFSRNETMHITLRGHSPGVPYDIKISNSSGTSQLWLGRTQPADALGQVTNPINWTIPATWPADDYTLTSHPAQGGVPRNVASMTSANQVASLAVRINAPTNPYLTIDGGYTWPAGSTIMIQANNHPQAIDYYFRFGTWRVPIPTGSPVNTFRTDANLVYATPYQIPFTATVGVTTTFNVSSLNNATNAVSATVQVTVLPVPVIQVLEAIVIDSDSRMVAPDTLITIQLLNHNPDTVYHIIYLDRFLGDILTNANGQGQLKYDLRQLPSGGDPPTPPAAPTSYGTEYPLFSQSLGGTTIATINLKLKPADLRITSIQVPASPAINSTVSLTFTVQNTSPVTITHYFDTDTYFDPSPLTPAYAQNQFNFPGDYKYWRSPSLAPGATFSFTQPYFIGSYGPHSIYGYADTSNLILNEPSELNNILSNTLTIACTPTFTTNTFSSGLGGWAVQPYGVISTSVTWSQIVTVSSNPRLRLTGNGISTLRSNDNANVSGRKPPSGYIFVHPTTPITTASGLDVRVQVLATTFAVTQAKAGLELRDPPSNNPTNAKVEFGLTYYATANQYQLEVAYRDSANPEPIVTFQSNGLTLGTPVWLRIQRYGGTNTFLFYYAQSVGTPTSWTLLHSVTIDLGNQLEYGLFMNNGRQGSTSTADFDNFAAGNPATCPDAQGPPPDSNIPPGLATCTNPLGEQGFEATPLTKWFGTGSNGVFVTTSAHAGNNALLADSNRPGPNNPFFYQRFAMPSGLVSGTTTVKLELFKNVEQELDGANPNDQFKVVLVTTPTVSISSTLATAVTIPAVVAAGDQGAIAYTAGNWQQVSVNLQAASGFNLASYAGQNLYLYFYDNSNQASGCPPSNCQNTSFYFDDIKLSPCTVQPLPPIITTRVKGSVTLHPTGGIQKIAGVKVWAYAENGALFETFTIQNGEFNFYNLSPVTSGGVKYFIYAEYFIRSSADPNQIEALTGNASVVVTSANNNANPVIAPTLHLY